MEETEQTHSLKEYVRLIREKPGWRILWLGEILSNLGNWLSYIATLLVVERLGDGKSIYLSVVLVIHFLPAFVLFPIAGVIADRFDRVKVLIWANVISAAAVVSLSVVHRPQELWLLYVLLFIEFSTSAFYDPARRALTPSLVPKNMLHLATTLDSFAWSFTAAIGASLGGLAASKIGPYACFVLDGITYLLATACAYRLKVIMDQQKAEPQTEDIELALDLEEPNKKLENKKHKKLDSAGIDKDSPETYRSLDSAYEVDEADLQAESSALLRGSQEPTQVAARIADLERKEGIADEAPTGCIPLLLWSVRDELGDMKEGWNYASHFENRDVLAMALLKAGGALTWGCADVLNVNFSQLPEMQSFGNAAFTLGLFFGSVGVACILGPTLFNSFTKPRPKPLLLACTMNYLFLWTGYLGVSLSHHVIPMLLSIMWRSFGSAVLWMYSTLLLQLRVPDHLLGRMLALEMAFFTVAESISGVFGGVALDDLHLSVRQTSLVMAAVGIVLSVFWIAYSIKKTRSTADETPSDRFYNS